MAFTIITASCIAAYYPCLGGRFVFDDRPAVVNNGGVTGVYSVREVFRRDFWGDNVTSPKSHGSYRPLTTLYFRLVYLYTGGAPDLFHLLNLIAHCSNCLLIYAVLWPLTKKRLGGDIALAASLLFAVHPVHVEPVCGVVGFADLAASLVVLLTMLTASSKKLGLVPEMIAVTLLASLAVFVKEQGIMLAPIVLAFHTLYRHRIHFSSLMPPQIHAVRQRTHYIGKLFFYSFCLSPTLLYLRLWAVDFRVPQFQEQDNPAAFMDSLVLRIVNRIYLYALNAWLLILPDWLCFDWAMGCVPLITGWTDMRIPVCAFFLCTVLCILFNAILRRRRLVLWALALIILPFVPAANIFFKVGFVVAERNLYLSVLGYGLLLAYSIRQAGKKYRLITRLGCALLICSYILKSRHRSFAWRTEESLFLSGLQVCPNNAKVHYNVAKIVAERETQHDQDLAAAEYRRALELYPRYEQAMNNLANIYRHQRNYAEAKKLLLRAVDINDQFPSAWMNLGIVQAALSEFDDSEKSYKRALELRPRYADCHFNLGNLYLKTRRSELASSAFQTAIEQRPRHKSAWSNLIMLLDEEGRFAEATAAAAEAIAILPEVAEFHFHLANVLGKQDKFEEAEEQYLRAKYLQPNLSLYEGNLGVLYHRWKRYKDAAAAYKRALSIDPNNFSSKRNLESLRGLY